MPCLSIFTPLQKKKKNITGCQTEALELRKMSPSKMLFTASPSGSIHAHRIAILDSHGYLA